MTRDAGDALAGLELAALRMAIGEQPAEDLPALAMDALVSGVDSPSLRILAGTSPQQVRDARDLFRASLQELGVDVPSEQDALWALVRHVAEAIVQGRTEPAAGAAWIWHHAYHRVEKEEDLRIFVGLASELEDHPADRERLEAAIVEASTVLLGRGEPRV